MGKSMLLRAIGPAALDGAGPAGTAEHIFVYIDFNLMVDMTEQAFYELILRSVAGVLAEQIADPQLETVVREAYQKVVDSPNAFLIPLGFNEGIVAICERLGRRLVLLFDEFDGPFRQLDQRVFLNLRALKDRYDCGLCYVAATGRRMTDMRRGADIGEFCELFAHQTLYLPPLNAEDVQHAVQTLMQQEGLAATPRDVAFVWTQSGGHPGLVAAVCYVLVSLGGAEDDEGYRLVCDRLDSDLAVRNECVKLWNGLDEERQEALLSYVGGEGVDRAQLRSLARLGLLRQEGEYQVFGRLFAGFVRRQNLLKSPYPPGVRVDVETGAVWVDGRRTETLTELEHRALLLFYGRMGQICTKYEIVKAVWGQEYIDEVDDARIEKLISRLRKKIEPDSGEPRYLKTVRGRGYMLVEG
jgi:hypothetical protein